MRQDIGGRKCYQYSSRDVKQGSSVCFLDMLFLKLRFLSKAFNSPSLLFILVFIVDHIKRKIRRRPSWGRGIIRRRKSYKKETEAEEEEEHDEAEGEAVGPSDSCMTQDEESSCDTMGPQPNGHHPHGPSTEEESSNEPLEEDASAKETESKTTPKSTETHFIDGQNGADRQTGADGQTGVDGDNQPLIEISEFSDSEAQPKLIEGLLMSQVECVNGNESMDSLDSQSLPSSTEAGNRATLDNGPTKPEEDEHKDKHDCKSTQEQPPHEGSPTPEDVEEDHCKEGIMLDLNCSLQLLCLLPLF